MGKRGIIGLKAKVGRKCYISRGGQIEQWRYTSWRSPRRKSQCYLQKKAGMQRQGVAPGVRASKSPEFGEGE